MHITLGQKTTEVEDSGRTRFVTREEADGIDANWKVGHLCGRGLAARHRRRPHLRGAAARGKKENGLTRVRRACTATVHTLPSLLHVAPVSLTPTLFVSSRGACSGAAAQRLVVTTPGAAEPD